MSEESEERSALARAGNWTIFLIAAGALFAPTYAITEIDLADLKAPDLGSMFLTLIFAALVIERAVEVFVNNRYEPRRMKVATPVRQLQKELKVYQEALNAEIERRPAAGAEAAAVASFNTAQEGAVADLRRKIDVVNGRLTEAKGKALPQLDVIAAEKASTAGAISVVMGLAVALSGILVFDQFLSDTARANLGTELHSYQSWIFRGVDTALTALLLAGGADGIHQLVKDFLGKRTDLGGLDA